MRPLLWVSKSHAKLAAALRDMGHRVSARRIPHLLEQLGYRRQVNRKTKEGGRHPDRDAQFEHINAQVEALQAAGQPVISVDTKKKELIGEFQERRQRLSAARPPDRSQCARLRRQGTRQGHSLRRLRHRRQRGWVSVGIDHDTAEFAVNAIRRWLASDGMRALPDMRSAHDHGRRRRLQRLTRAPVEIRTAKTRRRDRPDHRAFVTIRPARRNGTRSSIACSVTSRRTGAGGP